VVDDSSVAPVFYTMGRWGHRPPPSSCWPAWRLSQWGRRVVPSGRELRRVCQYVNGVLELVLECGQGFDDDGVVVGVDPDEPDGVVVEGDDVAALETAVPIPKPRPRVPPATPSAKTTLLKRVRMLGSPCSRAVIPI
jgi:hypothetical protein